MNYYIIPKNNFNINLNVKLINDTLSPLISNSLIFYLNNIHNNLSKIETSTEYLNGNTTIDYISKIVNPLEFVYTKVPGSTLTVSKIIPDSNIFFELMEIFNLFNTSEFLFSKKQMYIAHLTSNYTSTNSLLNMFRDNIDDIIVNEDFDYDKLIDKFIVNTYNKQLDLLICEFNTSDYNDINKYINNMLLIFTIITKYQTSHGTCIIKIDNVFYKAIIDIIFIFSAIYDKVYLIKPSISQITKGDRYIVCKSYNPIQSNLIKQIEKQIISRLTEKTISKSYVGALLQNEIPYFFLNKLEEINAVIGQQQLEAYDQIINIFKSTNREEKIDLLKRSHIQKSIQWCEKNNISHNKFIDTINIFFKIKKDIDNDSYNDNYNEEYNDNSNNTNTNNTNNTNNSENELDLGFYNGK
jgi:hypothetical protein